MKKLLPFLALAASVFAFPPAVSARPQDDDHGKHKGRYKHGDDDDDDGYRHDNGKHKGWYKHHDLITTIGITMASAFAPAPTIHSAVTRTFVTSLSSAASIRARGISFSTTSQIGSSRRTTFLVAATGNGTVTASTSITTTTIPAGTCSSIRASAALFTSSSSACSGALTSPRK